MKPEKVFPKTIWIGTNLWKLRLVEPNPNSEVAGSADQNTYIITITKDQHKTMAAILLHEILEILMLEAHTCAELDGEPYEYKYTIYHCPERHTDVYSALVTRLYETMDRNNLWEIMG